jgi:hypothetical protein
MRPRSGIYFPLLGVLITAALYASTHQALNGTWRLIPARAEFGGEPVIQTGTVTIADRQGNIYVSRDFMFDGESRTANYSSSTDGRANSWIHEGKLFKSKAKWEGNELRVIAVQDNVNSTERFSLSGDGTLMLVVERPGHQTITLYFERERY